MDSIFVNVSKLVSADYKLTRHSTLTQGLTGSKDIILWDDKPSRVSADVYEMFKEALRKRGSKFYTLSHILPYQDFCVAILSSRGYSLSHISTPLIQARTYIAAWRALSTILSTGDLPVKQWLSTYVLNRTASGYSSTHGVQLDTTLPPIRQMYPDTIDNKSREASNIIDSAIDAGNVEEIPYYEDGGTVLGVFHSSSTPESQLADLVIFHSSMNL